METTMNKLKCKNELRVYVVIPVFNPNTKYFMEQISSISKQTYKNIEVVFVISDNSSENIVTKLSNNIINNFSVLVPENKLGSYRAFEYGIKNIVDRNIEYDYYVALCDQDDIWNEDKLEICIRGMEEGSCDLIHSDAFVISGDGEVISESLFKLERRHRRTSPISLLYINNITGMTSVFSKKVAMHSLPFPNQSSTFFHHDLWLGLIASIMDGIKYIDQPLVSYRQHRDNVVGAIIKRKKRETPIFSKRMLKKQFLEFSISKFLAKSLYMRAEEISATNNKIVNRKRLYSIKPFLNGIDFGIPFFINSVFHLIGGNPQLSLKAFARGIVKGGVNTRSLLYGAKDGVRQWEIKQEEFGYLSTVGVLPSRDKLTKESNSSAIKIGEWSRFVDNRRKAKWIPNFNNDSKKSIIILIPTLNPTEVFAGVATALDLGIKLAERGHNVKFVTCDLPIVSISASRDFLLSRSSKITNELNKRVEIYDGTAESSISSNQNDVFVATAWWTAHVARNLFYYKYKIKKFVYLIQDFEPNFYPWGDDYAGAMESYEFSYIPIYNTDILKQFFLDNQVGDQSPNGLSFRPSIELKRYQAARRTRGEKCRFALYGRPEVARNMFATAVEAIGKFIEESDISPYESEWVSVGLPHENIMLPNGNCLKSLGKIPWESYPEFLSSVDIGVSLMYSPHPSHLPIEMAASGVRVVTNKFGNKDLSRISPLIISVSPSASGVIAGLKRAWLSWNSESLDDEGRNLNLSLLGGSLDECVEQLSVKVNQMQKAQRA
jgi:glycosyltransferase involved in cell wall biosynthesis